MGKFYGKVGYMITEEIRPSVWLPKEVVKTYYGDSFVPATRWQENGKVNGDISLRNQVSIVADGFAYQNFPFIKYVEWMGTKWSVESIRVERPRLILTLGGVYNGAQAETG